MYGVLILFKEHAGAFEKFNMDSRIVKERKYFWEEWMNYFLIENYFLL